MNSRFLSYGAEKDSVASRLSRHPPFGNPQDGCVTAMKKKKSPPEMKWSDLKPAGSVIIKERAAQPLM